MKTFGNESVADKLEVDLFTRIETFKKKWGPDIKKALHAIDLAYVSESILTDSNSGLRIKEAWNLLNATSPTKALYECGYGSGDNPNAAFEIKFNMDELLSRLKLEAEQDFKAENNKSPFIEGYLALKRIHDEKFGDELQQIVDESREYRYVLNSQKYEMKEKDSARREKNKKMKLKSWVEKTVHEKKAILLARKIGMERYEQHPSFEEFVEASKANNNVEVGKQ